jgi:hypothetical protein
MLSNIEKLNFYPTKNTLVIYYNGESIDTFKKKKTSFNNRTKPTILDVTVVQNFVT